MSKRAQFFLIAAFIVIAVLMGLGAIYVGVSSTKENSFLYDLSNEMTYEGARVIDHGVFNSLTSEKQESNIKNISNFYSKTNPDSEIIIVYGDEANLKNLHYEKKREGSVGIGTGSTEEVKQEITKTKLSRLKDIIKNEKKVTVLFENTSYTFDLRSGQNFFLILRKEKGGEQFISTNL